MNIKKIALGIVIILILLAGIRTWRDKHSNSNTLATSTYSGLAQDETVGVVPSSGNILPPAIPAGSSTTTPTNASAFLCQAPFPLYAHYENTAGETFFFEDALRTFLYTKHYDGSKTFMLSAKKDLNKTTIVSLEPSGECSGYVTYSVDPRDEKVYSPFSCTKDSLTYGYCPIAQYARSLLFWNISRQPGTTTLSTVASSDLTLQYGRGYGRYLVAGDKSTLLDDKSFILLPSDTTRSEVGTTIRLPLPDHPNETFTYTIKDGENLSTVVEKFAISPETIYAYNPDLSNAYSPISCLRVADKNSPFRNFCIATSTCQNIGENTIRPTSAKPFDLSIFNIPQGCSIEDGQ